MIVTVGGVDVNCAGPSSCSLISDFWKLLNGFYMILA